MRIIENVEMVHLRMTRDAVYDDFKEMDIAVDACPFWEDEIVEWKQEVLKAVSERYNKYGYWTEIIVSYLVIDDGKARYFEVGRV